MNLARYLLTRDIAYRSADYLDVMAFLNVEIEAIHRAIEAGKRVWWLPWKSQRSLARYVTHLEAERAELPSEHHRWMVEANKRLAEIDAGIAAKQKMRGMRIGAV